MRARPPFAPPRWARAAEGGEQWRSVRGGVQDAANDSCDGRVSSMRLDKRKKLYSSEECIPVNASQHTIGSHLELGLGVVKNGCQENEYF